MERIALIFKYFPPGKRLSGLVSFASLLVRELAKRYELHVFSHCRRREAEGYSAAGSCVLHPVSAPFWPTVGAYVRAVGVDRVILVSGVHKSAFLYPVFRPVLAELKTSTPVYFYQGTVLDQPPGRLGYRLLRQFDGVFCAYQRLVQLLDKQINGRCYYLPPGINVDEIRATPKVDKGAKIRIGYFSHFNRVKGFDLALKAFHASPYNDTEYVLAGKGPLEKLAKNRYRPDRRIHFKGMLRNPIMEMKACDFVLLPFRQSVSVLGISQAALECLAAGVPVIGSNVEVITAAIRHEKEGLIFQHPGEIVDCIRKLHDDESLRFKFSVNSTKRAESFRLEQVVEKMDEFIHKD